MRPKLLRILGSRFLSAAVLCVSVGLNALQAIHIFSGRLETVLPKDYSSHLSAGSRVPALDVKTLNGEPFTIAFGNSDLPTVIYVLSPSCIWCTANERSVAHLADALHGRVRFAGLSLDKEQLPDYLKDHPVPFPVYTEPAEHLARLYRLGSTPQTLVISPEGEVLRNWIGAFGGLNRTEISKYFGVSLPEIEQSSARRAH